MTEAFTSIATSIASVIGNSSSANDTPSSPTTATDRCRSNIPNPDAGMSPRRLADLQGKFLTQIEQLYSLYERGALTLDQFKKRKEIILKRLDDLAA